jgi:ribosome modulation factor
MTKPGGFPLRADMSRPRAEGYKAFRDGLGEDACPYKRPDPKCSEWRDGYAKAKSDKEKRDSESYR